MRDDTIPARIRIATKRENGIIAVDVSTNRYKKDMFDYEECGSVEDFQRLKARDSVMAPGKDEQGLFCQACNSEVYTDDVFCWYCGQRLKDGEKYDPGI